MRKTTDTDIYLAYYRYWCDNERAPVMREIGAMFGIAANTVYMHLKNLERDGFICYGGTKRTRAIRVPAYDKRKQRLERNKKYNVV